MFDYNDQHNDFTAVITASDLDFDTDIRFDNDTFSIDNGNLLAQFSTMHQDEGLRNVSFMKYDESLYANFPQSYVNKIHVDFLENFIKASVVIKAPSVEEEARLVKELTEILEPQVVSVDSKDLGLQDGEQPTVANTFMNPTVPSITFADSPDADAAFHDLLALPDVNPTISHETDYTTGQYDLPAPEITDKPANADDETLTENTSGQYDLPAPDITDRTAKADDITIAEEDSKHDVETPDDTNYEPIEDIDDLHLTALYDSMFLW